MFLKNSHCCLFLLLSAVGGWMEETAKAQDWHLVSVNHRDYVTLEEFARFYGLEGAPVSAQGGYLGKNRTMELRIPRSDSREIRLNGLNYWLGFPIETQGDSWLISRSDLVGLFEPLLRPQNIERPNPIRGVVIDPGHGGSDNGATSAKGNTEKTYTLDTAFRLEKLLTAAGLKTVMTRRSDIFIPLEERVSLASRYKDYLFVSVHFNFAQKSARGLETYAMTPKGAGSTEADGRVRLADYQRMPGNANDPLNILLGSEIHRQITQLNPGDIEADRGMKRARFVVLRDNVLPAVLVEGGFLTNRSEAALIDTPQYRQDLAAAISRGIQSYLQKVSKPLSQEPPSMQVSAPLLRTPPPVKPENKPASVTGPVSVPQVTVVAKPAPATPTPKASDEPTVTIYPVPQDSSPTSSPDAPTTSPALPSLKSAPITPSSTLKSTTIP